jgi:epoxyqueuosine reductase
LRNAAIVLGNRPTLEAIPVLCRGLEDDEPLVRGACAWALGRSRQESAYIALGRRLSIEAIAYVREEIIAAVKYCKIGPAGECYT